jgi:hypothetical protein
VARVPGALLKVLRLKEGGHLQDDATTHSARPLDEALFTQVRGRFFFEVRGGHGLGHRWMASCLQEAPHERTRR